MFCPRLWHNRCHIRHELAVYHKQQLSRRPATTRASLLVSKQIAVLNFQVPPHLMKLVQGNNFAKAITEVKRLPRVHHLSLPSHIFRTPLGCTETLLSHWSQPTTLDLGLNRSSFGWKSWRTTKMSQYLVQCLFGSKK